MPEHNVITDPNIHEPKGASTATDGQVYIADGAGSGNWTDIVSGWGFYKDSAAEQTFNTTTAKLSVDGLGSTSDTNYLPLAIRGTGQLWDTTDDKITPIAVGDAYDLRIDLPITSRSAANYAEIQLDIGGAATPTIVIATTRIETNRTAPFDYTITMPIFCLSTFLSNGGQIFISTDSGSIGVTAPGILLTRNHGEV